MWRGLRAFPASARRPRNAWCWSCAINCRSSPPHPWPLPPARLRKMCSRPCSTWDISGPPPNALWPKPVTAIANPLTPSSVKPWQRCQSNFFHHRAHGGPFNLIVLSSHLRDLLVPCHPEEALAALARPAPRRTYAFLPFLVGITPRQSFCGDSRPGSGAPIAPAFGVMGWWTVRASVDRLLPCARELSTSRGGRLPGRAQLARSLTLQRNQFIASVI